MQAVWQSMHISLHRNTDLRIIKHAKKLSEGKKEVIIKNHNTSPYELNYHLLAPLKSLFTAAFESLLHRGIQSFSLKPISSFSLQSSPFSPLQYIVLENQDQQHQAHDCPQQSQ